VAVAEGHAARRRLVEWLPWLVVAAALATSMATEAPARLGFTPCVFRNLTGLPCAGCGMTRGFVAMGHGHVLAAWRHNALAPLIYAAAWAYLVGFLIGRGLAGRSWPRPSPRARRLLYAGVLALVAASWGLSLHRYSTGALPASKPLVPWFVERLAF